MRTSGHGGLHSRGAPIGPSRRGDGLGYAGRIS